MRDVTETSITQAVLDSFAATENPRLRQLMERLTAHLHDFIRDVEPTFDEWRAAIDFLTRTGQICDDRRQEFILLSDTLGVSMLVDAINHRMPDGATQTTVLGPFYVENPPVHPLGANISNGLTGKPLYIEGQVTSAGGEPLPGATLDVWQSDGDGFYDVQLDHIEEEALRARFRCDAEGRFHFWSVVPSHYPIPDDGPVGEMLAATGRHPNRPAHVHFMISHDRHETLITHVFAAGSPYLDDDTVFGVKSSLVADVEAHEPGTAPDGAVMQEAWSRLHYDFGLKQTNRGPDEAGSFRAAAEAGV
jgi:hydroxyquinol 1,2-dioxygenase